MAPSLGLGIQGLGLFLWINIPYHLLADYTTKNIAKCYSNKIQSYQLSYEEGERLAV